MIYFLRAGEGDHVKIGYAVSVERRVRLLQTGNALPLKVFRVVPGDTQTEAAYHRRYRSLRIAREWFHYCPTMETSVIEAVRSYGPATRVIEKIGAARASEICNVDLSRIYRWTYPKERGGTGGHIPAKHQSLILGYAIKNGIDLTPADFFPQGRA